MPRCSIGMVVHVFSRDWDGPRAGTIVGGPFGGGFHADLPDQVYSEVCNVNVALDGVRDNRVLAEFRSRSEGNTLASIPVFEEAPTANQLAAEHAPKTWACWPPRVDGEAFPAPAPSTEDAASSS